jgi:hypothetical protein
MNGNATEFLGYSLPLTLSRSPQSRLSSLLMGLVALGITVPFILKSSGAGWAFTCLSLMIMGPTSLMILWQLRPGTLALYLDEKGFEFKKDDLLYRRRWTEVTALEYLPTGTTTHGRGQLFIGIGKAPSLTDQLSILMDDQFPLSLRQIEALIRHLREQAFAAQAPEAASANTPAFQAPPLKPLVRPKASIRALVLVFVLPLVLTGLLLWWTFATAPRQAQHTGQLGPAVVSAAVA